MVIFSVLVQEMCVLDTKMLVIAYSSGFGETPLKRCMPAG